MCCGARSGLRDSSSVKPGSRESELKREHEPLQLSWPNDDANVINSVNNFRFPFRQSLKGDTASFRHPYRDHRSRLFNQLLLQAIQSRKTTISSRVFHIRIAKSSTRLAPPPPPPVAARPSARMVRIRNKKTNTTLYADLDQLFRPSPQDRIVRHKLN